MNNRFRFLLRTLKRIRKNVAPGFIIGVRLAPEDAPENKGFNIYEIQELVYDLAFSGIDYLHLSTVNFMDSSWYYPGSSLTNLKRISAICPDHIAIVVSGGIIGLEDAEKALEEGATLVALGKMAIANPDWPRQISNPDFVPKSLPLSRSDLASADASEMFIRYLRSYNMVLPGQYEPNESLGLIQV